MGQFLQRLLLYSVLGSDLETGYEINKMYIQFCNKVKIEIINIGKYISTYILIASLFFHGTLVKRAAVA